MEWARSINEQPQPNHRPGNLSQPFYQCSEQLSYVRGVSNGNGTMLFTAPEQSVLLVVTIELFNRHSGDVTVTLRIAPPGIVVGTADATMDFYEKVLPARTPFQIAFYSAYPDGYSLIAIAGTPNVVNMKVSGMNLVQQ